MEPVGLVFLEDDPHTGEEIGRCVFGGGENKEGEGTEAQQCGALSQIAWESFRVDTFYSK